MNKFIRAIEIILVAIITDFIFLISDIYTDAQKQEMLDEIIYLAQKDGISLGGKTYDLYFSYESSGYFIIFGRLIGE